MKVDDYEYAFTTTWISTYLLRVFVVVSNELPPRTKDGDENLVPTVRSANHLLNLKSGVFASHE